MGCKNLCSLSPFGAPYSKPLFSTKNRFSPCVQKKREKKNEPIKNENLKIYLDDGLQKPLFFEPLRGALFKTFVRGPKALPY